ncbi:MAG: serine protein kinase PrkA [Desulfuromonadales bacterium]
MNTIDRTLQHLHESLGDQSRHKPLSFEEFLGVLEARPISVLRNVFQVFFDLIKSHIREGFDEYPEDPESIHYVPYDCRPLFVEGTDQPFFADRLFANRLVNLVEALKRGAQQNKIYVFEGPHGSGKSTFLNNLLQKFERYANTEEGMVYETVWMLDRRTLGSFRKSETGQFLDKLGTLLDEFEFEQEEILQAQNSLLSTDDFVEIPCPSHDNPILMVPKPYRRAFFEDLLGGEEESQKLFSEKEYEWVFRGSPCTICGSLYQALLGRLKNPLEVYRMLYARPYRFNRRLGEGITVFNPGDKPLKETTLTNPRLQSRVNDILRDSNLVKYIFSQYARTNNGVYALMDIKSHNAERFIELHNIISEGVHKVEDVEENVNSLFLALINPEDKVNIQGFQSFSDRIEYIKVPYVLDLNTEVEIYRNVFGQHIGNAFLPRVLHNFARIIISSRMNAESDSMKEWIGNPEKYSLFCDENLLLLKMEIYTGHIPKWLSEEDVKRLTAKRRRSIIGESEREGDKGFSGRDALKIFNDFYSTYNRKEKLIGMQTLCNYFTRVRRELSLSIPAGFIDSLLRHYDYTVLQEVKESLYYYNEEQISRDIKNYLFAVNFEPGAVETCKFTGDRIEISENFFEGIEGRLLGSRVDRGKRQDFREYVQREYATRTLTQEIVFEGKAVNDTELYKALLERYTYNLKEKVLEPFLENENFRNAIKDFDKKGFKTYDKRIRDDVTYLINNLGTKFGYTPHGAKEVCIYVIDNNLAAHFD